MVFTWWGAEEEGLLGSIHYVQVLFIICFCLTPKNANITKIACYLNMDMVGSPNYIIFILDGSTAYNTEAVNGSIVIQVCSLLITYQIRVLASDDGLL